MPHFTLPNGRAVLTGLLALGGLAAQAQTPVVDGTRDAAYPAALAVQTVDTQFGDHAGPASQSFAGGSELDNLHAKIVGPNLYLFVGGNLQSNFNKLDLFFDSKGGGQNTLNGNGQYVGNHNGLVFDAGFTADYALAVTCGNSPLEVYANYVPIPTGAVTGDFIGGGAGRTQTVNFGAVVAGAGTGTVSVDNSNVAGVGGGTGAANAAAATAVATGVEYMIPLTALGTTAGGGDIKIVAFINGSGWNFLSNQVLAGVPGGTGNLGSPSGVNFGGLAGTQFVTVANGAVATAPSISVNPTTLNFFNTSVVGGTVTRQITITNNGNAPLTVTGITSNNAAFSVSPATATVPGPGSTNVVVTFDPRVAGASTGSLTIASNDPTTPNVPVAVSGRGIAAGQVVLDGVVDGGGLYGTAKVLQTNTTGFGDNQSELNGAYTRLDGTDLYLTLTGNLENNGNKLAIFFDANPGTGQNTYLGSNATTDNSGALAGLTFDRGFRPERMLALNLGGTQAFASLLPLDGGTASTYLSTTTNDFTQTLTFAGGLTGELSVNNSNIGGVSNVALGNPGAVTTGIEVRIPLAALGYVAGQPLHVAAFIANGGYDYLSNQVLGGLPLGTGNLGADGAGNGGATVSVNFANIAGNQYFTAQSADLTVATDLTQTGGLYNNVSVNAGGVLRLGADLGVSGALSVNAGGSLVTFVTLPTPSCNAVFGPGSFAVGTGGALAVCAPGGIAASGATGNVQTSGSRSFGAGASYAYSGTAAQTTGSGLPATVANLAQNNPAGLTLSQPVTVANTLVLTGAGNLTTGGQALTLASNATGTALVVNGGTGTVVGNATVQRYINPALNPGEGYRHYSAPVGNTTLADLATPGGFAPVLTTAYNAAAVPGAVRPFPNVFAYDESRVLTSPAVGLDDFSKGWLVPTGAMGVGKGYSVRITAPQVVDFVGTLNNGDISLPLARTGGAAGGWAFVGNPYPAPLNYANVAPADRTGLDAAIYVAASSSAFGGSYRSYANGVGGNPIVPSCQGFFVRVSGASGTLTFRNAQRETAANATAFQRGGADTRPQIQLALATPGQPADVAYLYAETGATPAFDGQFDALKLPNTDSPNLTTVAAGTELSINGLPAFAAGLTVPLTLKVRTAGTYTLAPAALLNLPAGLPVYLTDARTGRHLLLAPAARLPFALSAADVAAPIAGRFALHFGPLAGPLTAGSALSAASLGLYPNPAHARVALFVPAVAGAATAQATLHNALGQVVRAFAPAALPAAGLTADLDLSGIAPGLYTLRVQAGAATATRKLVVE